jgi:D-glycero-beta-D-manno-heptose 1-phosphate adenylyltransferase
MSKVKSRQEIRQISDSLKKGSKKIVFTNGCFDLIHAGHIKYLRKAKELGDILIVGLNSDDSVKRLKGNDRPLNLQQARALVLSELISVDYIVIFEEDTPYDLIKNTKPDILVKGGDWQVKDIVGSELVLKNGGEVFSINYIAGFSTTQIINRIKHGT